MTQRYEDGQTFVSDGGGGIPEIVNTALVYSQPGRLDLLPALPAALPTGEIRGLAGRSLGGAKLTIARLAWTAATVEVELVSTKDQTLAVRAPKNAVRSITLKANQPASFHFSL
jgi:hypothetical protein